MPRINCYCLLFIKTHHSVNNKQLNMHTHFTLKKSLYSYIYNNIEFCANPNLYARNLLFIVIVYVFGVNLVYIRRCKSILCNCLPFNLPLFKYCHFRRSFVFSVSFFHFFALKNQCFSSLLATFLWSFSLDF